MRCGAFHRVEGTLCLVRHGQAALSGAKTKAPGFAGGYLLWHRASSLHSAAPSRAQLRPGQVCGFPSPHPDQGLMHRLTKTELTAVVTRSMLPACVVLAGRNCRLVRTKQQLAWLCEMPPTRGYPHP